MVYVGLFLSLLLSGVSSERNDKDIFNFNQSDYHVEAERTELVSYSKQYFKHFEIRNFKYNRTVAALNGTVIPKIDFGDNLLVRVQVYKFLSNEYRYFPIRRQLNICDILSINLAGLSLSNGCGNVSECPFKKNKTYVLCNWALDQSKFPPLMPSGRYMAECFGLYNDIEMFVVKGYAKITYPLGAK